MPRLRYIDEAEKTERDRKIIESARRTGAPDPRVVSIMLRNPRTGAAWVEYWNTLLYHGVLPHKLKEMCRIKISVAHQCGYCSTVRSAHRQGRGPHRGPGHTAAGLRKQHAVLRTREGGATVCRRFQEG